MTRPPEDRTRTHFSKDEPARDGDQPTTDAGDLPDRIGRYRIVGKLGEGGMGVVYEAEQESPRRRVALKVIRGGQFVDDARVGMFRREVETLARLEHPNIGAIYESGRTDDGQHFFAMELVRGQELDDYLRSRPTAAATTDGELRFRLSLLREIADAVHYAHQRGVIHRDLKPSNIVVIAGGDRSPSIKILDFGLARITEGDIAAASVVTEIGVIKGTVPYMSPEQTRGNSADIDVRSDVYALGVILYEMLSGKMPYETSNTSLIEAVRVICEQPPRSLRQTLSAGRRLDPDVETIVGKALEKDAGRRYASAAALSEDIERFLTSQPILARPPSTIYQLRKFAARNRTLVGGVIAVIIVLIAGVIGTGWQAIVATRQRERAETEAAKARQVAEFSQSILSGVGPEVALGRDTTLLREVLDRAVENIDAEALAGQPEVESEIRYTVGNVYSSLGEYDLSRPHLQRALELSREASDVPSEHAFNSLSAVANLALNEGRYEDAESLYREAVEIARAVHGEDHPQMATALSNLGWVLEELGRYDEAESLARQAVAIMESHPDADPAERLVARYKLANVLRVSGRVLEARQQYGELVEQAAELLPEEHPNTMLYLNALGIAYNDLGEYDESIAIYERALALSSRVRGADHPETLTTRSNMVTTLMSAARYEEAETLAREVLARRIEKLGPEHPHTLISRSIVVVSLLYLGRDAEAAELGEEVLRIQRRVLGPDHPDAMVSVNNVASAYRGLGRLDEAARMQAEHLSALREAHGDEHPMIAISLRNQSFLFEELGDLAAAEAAAREALELRRRIFGNEHPDVVEDLGRLASVAGKRGDLETAETLHGERFELARRLFGEADFRTGKAYEDQAFFLSETAGRPDEAGEFFAKALSIYRDVHEVEHRNVQRTVYFYAEMLDDAGRGGDATALYREYVEDLRGRPPEASSMLAWGLGRLGGRLSKGEEPARALPLLDEAIAIYQRDHPDQIKGIADARSVRGGILVRLGRFDEAEPLLIDSYDTLKGLGSKGRTAKALGRIVEMYEAWGKPAEAARWREEQTEGP